MLTKKQIENLRMAGLTQSEKLIIRLLCRLFWLVTQAPGVARYVKDVRTFVDAEKMAVSPEEAGVLEGLAAGYENSPKHR